MSRNNEIVSVIIPCTDRTIGIERCLRSVISQDYIGNIEIILVENNSKNKTVITSLLNKLSDIRIKHYYLEDCSNANVARNYGATNSAGEVLAFLDSDDEWLDDHISSSIDSLNDHEAIYSGFLLDNGFNRKNKESRKILPNETPYSFLFGRRAAVAQTSSYVLKKDVLKLYSWDESLKRNQDYDFFIGIQKTVGWGFKPSITSIVYWDEGASRTYSLEAFSKFYVKHCEQMTRNERAAYLVDALKGLATYSKVGYLDFQKKLAPYRSELKIYDSIFTYNILLTKFMINMKSIVRRLF